MNILHCTSWLSRLGGGIPPVIWSLADSQGKAGLSVSVVGLSDKYVVEDTAGFSFPVFALPIKGPQALGYSPKLRDILVNKMDCPDVVHYHSLWMWPGYAARQLATKNSKPLLISPHGMLEPWALQNSRWKKRIVGWLFENKNLRSAACIHALCNPEYHNIRQYGLKNPVAAIPNGIDIDEYTDLPEYNAIEDQYPSLKGYKRALFLSRIHPKKGLLHLLRAWKDLGKNVEEWMLIVAGPNQIGHQEEVKSLASELGIGKRVLFTGPLYSEDKLKVLAGSDLFVLPSFSEGFSMAILEAAASGLPVLLTPPCNFSELVSAGGALEVEPSVSGTKDGLRQFIEMSNKERMSMGMKGRSLVKSAYTWPKIASDMINVYKWLLGQGEKPDCVRLD